MGLQLKSITRLSGEHCQHLSFDCVLDGEKTDIPAELERLKAKFNDEPGGYRGVLLLLFALYQIEQGRNLEHLNLYIA